MAEIAHRFGYPVHVLTNPPHAKQPHRAHYAGARNSRALQGRKHGPIWLSSAGTPLSATRKTTLPSALCASSQFESPARQKTRTDLVIQCRYSPIRQPQSNSSERVMRELAIREPALRKALAYLVIQCSYSPIRHPQNDPTKRVMRELAIRETCMAKCSGRFVYPVQILRSPSYAEQSYRSRYARSRNSRALYGGKR
jgi:hypothetical protein